MSFNLLDLGIDKFNWIWLEICAKAKSTEIKPISRSDVDYLINGLKDASTLQAWKPLSMCRPEGVALEMVMKLFTELEDFLLEAYTLGKASKTSTSVRGFLSKKFSSEGVDPRLKRINSFFRTRCKSTSIGRELISDVAHPSRPSIGAVSHENLAELHLKTAKLLVDDLERVRVACVDALQRHRETVKQIERLEKISLGGVREKLRASALLSIRNFDLIWDEEQCESYFALLISINNTEQPCLSSSERPRVSAIIGHARKLVGDSCNPLAPLIWLKAREMPSYEVLLACALVIQIKTGWNFSSVLLLSTEMLDVAAFPHRLRSTKSKIKGETPLVMIEESDEDVLLALLILRERSKFLKKLGYIDSSVWSGWGEASSNKLKEITNWNYQCRKLCKKYDLPKFSLDMLRGQVLAVDTVVEGNFAKAQSRAGHIRSSTTFHYINKAVLRRLNSANVLEFERRFDATVRYMIDKNSASSEQRLIAFPIGNGSSCRNPNEPPKSAWRYDGVCTALNCHKDGGCSNMLIEIDIDRIREVVLTKKYYENNWKRLLNSNPAGFEKLHLDNLLFTFALFGSISRGPYRHLVRKVENE